MADKTTKLIVQAETDGAKAKLSDLGNTVENLGKRAQTAGKEASKGIDSMGDGASGAAQKIDRSKKSISDLGAAARLAGKEAAAGIGGIGSAAAEAARKAEASTRSIASSIQREIALLQAGEKGSRSYYEALAKQRGISGDALKPYLDQLDSARRAQEIADAGLQRIGVSAKQTAAAMRQVPAQLTDIAVSLQSGQSPLTVLFQQGGQLKDMFGGIGPAARALGAQVAGLVNPFTVAAAAVAGLGYAFSLSAERAAMFREAIALSGNAAGTTVGQLEAASRRISDSVGSRAEAAEALTAMVNTGKVASRDLDQFATTAVRAQRALGTSLDETAKRYAALARDPLQAILKLNDGQNFLTVAVREQIKALESQGRQLEAGELAQRTYDRAMAARITELEGGLSRIQRGWRDAGRDAKAAWEDFTGGGRDLRELFGPDGLMAGLRASAPGNIGLTATSELERLMLRMKPQLDRLTGAAVGTENSREMQMMLRRQATSQSIAAAANEKQLSALNDWDKLAAGLLTDRERLEKKIAEIRRTGLAAGKSELEIERAIAVERANAAKGGRGSKSMSGVGNDNDLTRLVASLEKQLEVEEKLSQVERTRAELARMGEAAGPVSNAKRERAIALALAKDEIDAVQAQAAAWQRAGESASRYLQTLAERNTSIANSVTQLKDERSEIGLSISEVTELRYARAQEAIAVEEQRLALARAAGDSAAEIATMEERIRLLREEADLRAGNARRSIQVDGQRDIARASARVGEQLHDDVSSAISRALSDKNPARAFAENLAEVINSRVHKRLADALADALVGADGKSGIFSDLFEPGISGKKSSGGGLFGSIGSSIGNWFGGLFGSGAAPQISSMGAASLIPGFAGGGSTGDGPRSGGLDGMGGFLALMHPQETVTDHARGQTAGRAITNNISVNVSGAVDRRSANQLALEVARKIRVAEARLG